MVRELFLTAKVLLAPITIGLAVGIAGMCCLASCTPDWSDLGVFDVLPKTVETFVLPPIDDPEWAE